MKTHALMPQNTVPQILKGKLPGDTDSMELYTRQRGARPVLAVLTGIGLMACVTSATLAAPVGAAHTAPTTQALRLFVAGDSTAATYGPERYPQTGWGAMLQCGLKDVTVLDYAKPGRSTKSYMAEGRLEEIAGELKPGDTVLISFGHNDEKADEPVRFTDPDGDYRTNLEQYIAVMRKHGAIPVLVTPVTRRSFENGKVIDTHAVYASAMRDVAQKTGTKLIDLTVASMRWLAPLGPEKAKKYYLYVSAAERYPAFPNGSVDDTHFTELGARAIANLVDGELARLGLPVSRHVLTARPALTRPVPVGGPFCQ